MIQRLKNLQATKSNYRNGRELQREISSNYSFRKEIEYLSKTYLHKTVSGCSNCYLDAYIQLVNLSTKQVMEQQKCQFRICRGVLMRDVVNLDASLNMTILNTTNDLALYHLKTNPSSVKYFTQLPDDWEKQVEAFDIEAFLHPEKKAKKPRKPRKVTPKSPEGDLQTTEEENTSTLNLDKSGQEEESSTSVRVSIEYLALSVKR